MEQQAVPRRTTVEELVHAFENSPRRVAKLTPSEPDLARWGIRSHALTATFYVTPNLECTAQPDAGFPFCYLISAPAAVGKTTLANHLHDRLVQTGRTVLYVPLQQAKIGDRYLAGLLCEAFPAASKLELFEALFGGSVVLLFDGYDEVSMTTWQIDTNKRFIAEVVEAYSTYGKAVGQAIPCMVFLYRSVFDETGIFDNLTPHAAHYRVEFFDREQRRLYLRSYLQAKGEAGGKLVPLVDHFLKAFEQRAAAASPQADAFFGHAVVLSAFGDFLVDQDESNAYKLAQELGGEGVDETSSVKILRGVIDSIVDREAGKFPIVPSLQPLGAFNPFDRALQERIIGDLAAGPVRGFPLAEMRSLAGRLGREKLEACPGFANLPETAQQSATQDYLENLNGKLELHPFLDGTAGRLVFRNALYQEYYLARYLADRPSVPLSSAVATDRSPSYYLALFLLSLVPERDLTQYGGTIFYTLRLLSSACQGDEYQIDITYQASSTSWFARVDSENLKVDPFRVGGDPLLALALPADAVLQNFSVDGQNGGLVSVSGPQGYDTKSPLLLSHGAITGTEVELDAAAFTFDTVTVNADLLTLADRVSELNGLDTLTIQGRERESPDSGETVRGKIKLQASEYARNRWGRDLNPTTEGASTLETFRSKMKKILLWFRRHARQEYAVYRPRFYTCATNKRRDAIATRIAQFLLDQSILRDGQLIVLNQDKLAEYDVFYVKQNELRFGPGFRKLFDLWQQVGS
jgi:hypothetical protein